MNKDNAYLYLPYVQALVDGHDVETRDGLQNWRTIGDYAFTSGPNNYRVKPTKPRLSKTWVSTDTPYDTIELTNEVKDALEKAGIPYE